MTEEILEQVYRESLEERLIAQYAEMKGISLEEAMRTYYNSALAEKIYRGTFGIQYLDYKLLAQLLEEQFLSAAGNSSETKHTDCERKDAD